jgi:indole-3-acetate monooxygenase
LEFNDNRAPELNIAVELSQELEAFNVDAEVNCRVNKRAIDLMRSSGLLAMTIPAVYGGAELDVLDNLKVIEQLSYADSALGWSAMIYSKTAHLGAAMPEHWARQVYSHQGEGETQVCPITAGAAAPTGKGRKVDGGIMVTGRWAWGSGAYHADWIAGGTLVEDNGEIVRLANGQPAVHLVFFKREEVLLHENWDPSGLRGTGSSDFEVTEVFVPEGRWMVLDGITRVLDTPLYRFPALSYFAAAVAVVPLGIARRALDDFQVLVSANGKTGKSSKTGNSIVQFEFGQAEALVASARHVIWGSTGEMWNQIISGTDVELEDKRQVRLAAVQATQMCTQAVAMLYSAAGGAALQGHCSMQKHFRDINAATQHRQVSREFYRLAGGVRLDGESPGLL